MILTRAALAIVLGIFCGRSHAADWISAQTVGILVSQSRELARLRAAYVRKPAGEELLTRADAAFHAGHYWEMRRLIIKVVDLDPQDDATLGTLAYMISMYRSDGDTADGKENVRYAVSDFADLGGLTHKDLLQVVMDPTEDRFAKARAVLDWGEHFNRANPDFYLEYAEYIGYGAGSYHKAHANNDRAFEEFRAGVDAYQKALNLIGARPSRQARKPEMMLVRDQANLCLRLIELMPERGAPYRALAARNYRRILASPLAGDSLKESARRHLTELGEPAPALSR